MNYRILNSKIDTCVNGKLDCKETLTVLVNGDCKVSPSVCGAFPEGKEVRGGSVGPRRSALYTSLSSQAALLAWHTAVAPLYT